MSLERHGNKYKPKHRSKRLNKVRRAKKGPNRGSRFDGTLTRKARLMKAEKAKKAREKRDERQHGHG